MNVFEVTIADGMAYIKGEPLTLSKIISHATPAHGFKISIGGIERSGEVNIILTTNGRILATRNTGVSNNFSYNHYHRENWYGLMDKVVNIIRNLEKDSGDIFRYTETITYGDDLTMGLEHGNPEPDVHDITIEESIPPLQNSDEADDMSVEELQSIRREPLPQPDKAQSNTLVGFFSRLFL